MQCGEARILVEISCSYIFVGSWQWRLGTVGAPAPAQETLSRQRRTGSCIQMMIYPASSRRWHILAQVHPAQFSSLDVSFPWWMQCCGVSSLQPLCRGVQCAKQMLECCPHPAQPAQHSTAQLGSAQISRAKFLGMEFINQLGLSPLQPASHQPPATGPSLAWIIQRNCLIISISLIYPLTLAM